MFFVPALEVTNFLPRKLLPGRNISANDVSMKNQQIIDKNEEGQRDYRGDVAEPYPRLIIFQNEPYSEEAELA